MHLSWSKTAIKKHLWIHIENHIHQKDSLRMTVFSKKQNRFQMSYKEKEAGTFLKIEKSLMDDLCIPTRSDLHKYALRYLYKIHRQQKDLTFVWGQYEASKNQWCSLSNAYGSIQKVENGNSRFDGRTNPRNI